MPMSYMTKIGFCVEKGTPAWGSGGSPDKLLPVNPPTFTVPFEQLLDNALRGVPAVDFAAYQGAGRVEGSLEGPFYPEELGYFLLAMMGAAETNGGTPGTVAPWTHVFTLHATPPSLAIQDETEVEDWRYTGIRISELSLAFNSAEGFLNYSASLIGKERQVVGAGSPIPADLTSAPFRGWQGSATIGTAPYATLMEGELTLSREVTLFFGLDGLTVPAAAFVGPLAVTGRATLNFTQAADYDRYLLKNQEPFRIEWSYGTPDTASHKKLTFLASNMDFGEGPVELDRSGAHITLAYSLRALYNTDDGGPCQFELINAEPLY